MTFEEKILTHFYPSKDEIINLHNKNYSRKEICEYFNFSESTYKKLRRYYNIPIKQQVHVYDEEDYKKRTEKTQKTLDEKYGEKGTATRQEFYRQNRIKSQQTNLKKYGVFDASHTEEANKKRIDTYLNKYGVDNPMKDKDVQQKAQQTDLIKYGSRYHINAEEVQEKARQTIKEKYGTRSEMLKQFTPKKEQTNLKKYGVKCVANNPEIRKKILLDMQKKGNDPTLSSSQQRYINSLLGGELNFLVDYYHIDSFVERDGIGVEYSGSGHDLSVRIGRETPEHFAGKEKARKNFFINRKIPILEFVSKTDKLPSDETIIHFYEMAKKKFLETNFLYCCVKLDTNEIVFE